MTAFAIRLHPNDSVAVLVAAASRGEQCATGKDAGVELRDDVPAGHKVALRAIAAGEPVIKYGFPIGIATVDIEPGTWVHSHNLRTALGDALTYQYSPVATAHVTTEAMPEFLGYRRPNGRVGTRNEVWIINTVGCVNQTAERVARDAASRFAGIANVDGVHAFAHPYGCSQLGDDLGNTQRILAGLLRHPNAGGVLVLGLGCENNQMQSLLAVAEREGGIQRERLRFFNTQEVVHEIDAGVSAVGELVALMANDRRTPCPASDLLLGHKCGGSDGFSGITANPLLGRIADRLTSLGGGVLLTEVPEMFGAEQLLMNRAESEAVANDIGLLINDFKAYFTRHGQPVSENPSPGNLAGGITTLEEKSLGAIQKGGQATVRHVVRYGRAAPAAGLTLLESPGNDAVSSTALVASGATLLLFTTGRGTPLGFPVPTLKIASNSELAAKKPHWIDFDAGRLLSAGATFAEQSEQLFALILDVASGRVLASNERNDNREIAIWKAGVTL